MPSNSEYQENKLVALASIAAELQMVMSVAWGVSLAAKNAKVISAQAGDKGLGFQPITEFIDEISRQAMTGVEDINREALRLSKITVNEQRSADAFRRFDLVRKKNTDAQYIKSMQSAMEQVENTLFKNTQEFKKSLSDLSLQMEAMKQCMLSARAIASVSRIVTSNAQEYSDKLKVVADDLDQAAIYIKDKLLDSYTHLNNVNVQGRLN